MIVHLAGCMCGGKTTFINNYRETTQRSVSRWDIKEDFHIPQGIIKNGNFDIDKYMKIMDQIEDKICLFMLTTTGDINFIESSGFNSAVNLALVRMTPAYKEMFLEVPDDLAARAEKRNENVDEVLKFATKYKDFVKKNNVVLYTEQQAQRALAVMEKYSYVQFGYDVSSSRIHDLGL